LVLSSGPASPDELRRDQDGEKARARRPPAPAPRKAPLPATTLTHRDLTERYNTLVPRALALGITAVANSKVRPHTSAFELGVRIIAALEGAIAAARAEKPGAAPRPRRERKG
jgi:hypothetical protein